MKDFIFDLQRFATISVGTADDVMYLISHGFSNGDTIQLADDIDISSLPTNVTIDSNITLDLNGKDLTAGTGSFSEVIIVANTGNLTIKDSSDDEEDSGSIQGLQHAITNNGTVNLYAGILLLGTDTTQDNNHNQAGATFNVYGGTVEGIYNYATLNVYGGSIGIIADTNANAAVYISGGEVTGYIQSYPGDTISITGGTFSSDVSAYVASSSTITDNGNGTYSVTAGDGVINNSNDNTLISGSAGADEITNSGHHVTINAGAGDDTINIEDGSSRSVIQYKSGDGDDVINNYENFTEGVISLNSGVSSYNIDSSNNHIIRVGNGSIKLTNLDKNAKVAINASGTDYTYINAQPFLTHEKNGTGLYTTTPLSGTSGNDFINVFGSNVTINSGAGDDYVLIDSSTANEGFIVNSGTGADTIDNLTGRRGTINAGAGNDVISLGSSAYQNVIQFKSGDGSDVVYGYDDTDSVYVADETAFSTAVSGNDVVVNVGSASLTLKDAKDKTLNISGGLTADDTIVPSTTTTDELTYNEITNKIKTHTDVTLGSGWAGTLSSGDYESTVKKIDASEVTGKLYIIGNDNANSIIGGEGSNTISGGKGNDTLSGNGGRNVFLFTGGEGNDLITDYESGVDSIKLSAGTITAASSNKSNKNVVLTVANGTAKGTLTLKNAYDQKITVVDAEGNKSAQVYGAATINVADSDGSTIDTSGNTSVVKIDASYRDGDVMLIGNAKNNSIYGGNGSNTLSGGTGNDIIIGSADYTITSGKTSTRYSGYGTDNTIVYSAGNDIIYGYNPDADKIQLAAGSISTYAIKNQDVVFTILTGNKKSTLTVKDGRNKRINFIDTNGVADTVNSKIYRLQSDYIVTDLDNATVDVSNNSAITMIDASNSTGELTTAKNLTIIGNSKVNTIKAGAGNNTIYGGGGNDVIILDSSTTKADTVVYTAGDGKVVVQNFNASTDQIKLGSNTIITNSSFNKKTGDLVLTITNGAKISGTLTLKAVVAKNSEAPKITVIDSAGNVTTQQYGVTSLNVANGDGDTINIATMGNIVTLNAGDTGGNRTTSVYMVGNAKNNVIIGGSGADTLDGGTKVSTLTGGNGADVFIPSTTTTTITDYQEGDKIYVGNDRVTKITTNPAKNADLVLTFDSKKVITIKDAVEIEEVTTGEGKKAKTVKSVKSTKKLTFIDAAGNESSQAYGSADLTIADDDGATIDTTYNTTAVNMDASARTTAVNLVGNKNDNSIVSGTASNTISGGDGNDTIVARNNSTVTGSNGNDVYVFEVGGDVASKLMTITDYEVGKDTIVIKNGEIINALDRNGDVTFYVGAAVISEGMKSVASSVIGTIVAKGGAGKSIKFISQYVDDSGEALYPDTTAIYGNNNVLTLTDADNAVINTNTDREKFIVKKVDASARRLPVYITGNYENGNTLIGGVGDDVIAVGGQANILIGGGGNDVLHIGGDYDTLVGGMGDDVFYYAKGVGSEIVITDYEAGKDTLVLDGTASITNASVNGSDVVLTLDSDKTITLNGAKDKKITVARYEAEVDEEGNITHKKVGDNEDGDDIIVKTSQVYGSSTITAVAGDGDTIDANNGANANVIDVIDASKIATDITLIGNDKANTILGGKKNDVIYTGEYSGKTVDGRTLINAGAGNDTIYINSKPAVSDEDTSADIEDETNTSNNYVSNFSIIGGAGADLFVYSGGNATIGDYNVKQKDIIAFNGVEASVIAGEYNYYIDGKDVVFQFGTVDEESDNSNINELRIVNGLNQSIAVTSYEAESELPAIGEDNTKSYTDYTVKTFTKKDNTSSEDFEYASGYTAETYIKTINAAALSGKLGLNITGSTAIGNSIIGSAKSDTINAMYGDNTLKGGAGNDYFFYNGGNDELQTNNIITDYTAGQDAIIFSGDYSISSVETNVDSVKAVADVVFNISDGGTITVKDAYKLNKKTGALTNGKKITFATGVETTQDAKGNDIATLIGATSQLYGDGAATLTVANTDGDTIYMDSDLNKDIVTAVNAKSRGALYPTTIYDNAADNVIIGGAGADVIYSRNGSNTVTGSGGNNFYSYQGGNLTVTDYAPLKDAIKIENGMIISNSAISNKDIVLTVSDSNTDTVGTVTIKNGKGKQITVFKGEASVERGIDEETGKAAAIIRASYDETRKRIYGDGEATVKVVNSELNGEEESGEVSIADHNLTTAIDASAVSLNNFTLNLTGNTLNNVIKGGSKGNVINGVSGNNTLIGGASADILNGGTGNNVYTGGGGKDTFVYSGGNLTITDYAAGQDVISLGNGMSVSDFEYVNNNKNLVLKISNGTSTIGSVTINNGVNKKIAIGSDLESAVSEVYGLKTLTATAGKDEDSVTVNATTVANKQVTTINASGLKAAVSSTLIANNNSTTINGGAGSDNVTGGAGNDLIKGNAGNDAIDGGTGNNTIYGGKGNDNLVGSAGRDNTSNVFSYANGDGNDVITKYGASDKITVTGGAVIGVNLSSDEKDVIFKIAAKATATTATGTITVKDAGTTAINVNGKTYKIGEGDLATGSSERLAGFVEEIDDELLNSTNFTTGSDNSLDSIMNVGISNAVSTDELYTTTSDITSLSKVTASVYNKKNNK